MQHVNIYTESSIKGPRKRDGVYGYVLEMGTSKGPATLTKIEYIKDVTENKSELMAIIGALKRLKGKCELTIYTESSHVAAGFQNGWIDNWIQSEWKNAKGKDVANKEEWQEMHHLLNEQEFELRVSEEHSYKEWLKKEVNKKSKGE